MKADFRQAPAERSDTACVPSVDVQLPKMMLGRALVLPHEVKVVPAPTQPWAARLDQEKRARYRGFRELAGLLALSHPGAVRCVDRLVKTGLVSRSQGADARVVTLRLTTTGKRRWHERRSPRMACLNSLVESLTPAKRKVLSDLISSLLQHLAVTPAVAERICRLCDETICEPKRCPITDERSITQGQPGD